VFDATAIPGVAYTHPEVAGISCTDIPSVKKK
jgi:pyruvate/2-oxoglutarate dehydrogenase complex dihydrolipoamide dehydrogenase (E3) component